LDSALLVNINNDSRDINKHGMAVSVPRSTHYRIPFPLNSTIICAMQLRTLPTFSPTPSVRRIHPTSSVMVVIPNSTPNTHTSALVHPVWSLWVRTNALTSQKRQGSLAKQRTKLN